MRKAIIDNFSKEELEQIVKESFSIKEVVKKLGYSSSNGDNHKTVKNKLALYNISIDHFQYPTSLTQRNTENVFVKNATCSQATLRRWYIKGNYTEYKCSICGQKPFWNGKELTLTLDHINGDNKDNQIENLRWVCPNCDRQLDTFGFKRGAK